MNPYGTHAMLGSSCSHCRPQAAEPSPAPATPAPSELPAPAAGSGTAAVRQQREAGTGDTAVSIDGRAILPTVELT